MVALVKQRKYWPKHIPGQQKITHMEDTEVGDCDAIHRIMDEKPFYLFAMKQPDYTMILMSTYRRLLRMGETKHHHYIVGGQNGEKEFKHIEAVQESSYEL